jgi:EAL domain-containing protein (putative c-di-GMP-specific phosphodiesterase class I)
VIQQLHDMQVHLHIDDFGTGYSSLSYLHNFPVHTLKVDKSFVSRMEDAPHQAEIVRAIVSLAQNLGMEVTAEGVETRAQADALQDLHCTNAQGYLFSRPLPADEAERLIIDGLPPY